MTPNNFDSVIRSFQHHTPFQPYTVGLVNGQSITIDHSEALVLRGGLAVYIDRNGVPVFFDHESVSEVIGEDQRASA